MAERVRVRAAAKINLHLRVYRRRPDGFHDLRSLFQAVSLSDSLVIRSLKELDTIEIEGDFDCPVQATTVYKAIAAYRRASGDRSGVGVVVDKGIPAGAGLGGGSSDAAATLVGLEALLRRGLDTSALSSIGASIGSDVPFFLGSGASLVEGRGELIAGLPPRTDYHVALAFPGFGVATAEAYRELDEARPDDSAEPDPGAAALASAYEGDPGEWPFANSFEGVIGASRPRIPSAKAILLARGASFAAMSGSGSTVFGIYRERGEAEAAVARLLAAGYGARSVSPLAHPLALG
jgi:4-diphosphocytidyl-2-C-methyl-D-erythritol kinase